MSYRLKKGTCTKVKLLMKNKKLIFLRITINKIKPGLLYSIQFDFCRTRTSSESSNFVLKKIPI